MACTGLSLLPLVGIFILGLIIYEKRLKRYIGSDNRNRYFAKIFKDFPEFYNTKTKSMKQLMFKSLGEMGKEINILEIGVGPGGNFDFYPKTVKCHLFANDPNLYFHPILQENIRKFPQVILDKISSSSAENLLDIADSSMDAVISTMVLCSVPNVEKALKEVVRVLKPGGKFFYMEHVIDPQLTWWRTLQQTIDFFGIWAFIADGCHASRRTASKIECAGFASIDQKRFYIDTVGFWGLYIIKPHIYGVAVKG